MFRSTCAFIVFAAVACCSCAQKHTRVRDPSLSRLTLSPGRGLHHVCELGMPLAEVESNLGITAKLIGTHGSTGIREYELGGLPLRIHTDDAGKVIKLIVQCSRDGHAYGGQLSIDTNTLSVADASPQMVTATLGVPLKIYEEGVDWPSQEYVADEKRAIPIAVRHPSAGVEYYIYGADGIGFRFVTNSLSRIFIDPPGKPTGEALAPH